MSAAALAPVPTETNLAPYLVRASDYIRKSRATSTLRGYQADFRDFDNVGVYLPLKTDVTVPHSIFRP